MHRGRIQSFNSKSVDLETLNERYIKSFIVSNPKVYIDNADVILEAFKIDELTIPIVISQEKDHTTYTCSIYSHYIAYAYKELERIENYILRKIVTGLLITIDPLFKLSHIDKVVYVNNSLLATNLYPNISKEQIKIISDYFHHRFPDYAIAFKSVNNWHPKELQQNLEKSGYKAIPSRKIFYTDINNQSAYSSRMFRSDLKILKNTPYKILSGGEIKSEWYPRIAELYKMLNIKKYSSLNPQLNESFIELIHQCPDFTLKVWEKNGSIDAVLGYFQVGDTITSPLFGYDTTQPQEEGLYRMLSTQLLVDAKEKGLRLHQSSGGASYKTLRRAEETIESLMVSYHHLSFARRIPWNILQWGMKLFGKQFL